MASLSSLAFHDRVESMRLWGLLSEVDPMLRTTGLVAAMRAGTAFAHFLLGRYDEAASWAAMASQDNPDYNGRTARAGTQGNGSAAATQSRATCFHSQRRGGPLARRRPLPIGRRIAASWAARISSASEYIAPSEAAQPAWAAQQLSANNHWRQWLARGDEVIE